MTDLFSENLRIKGSEPLTLYCSTLTSYIWQDYIRTASPIVNYLSDKFEIRQLSRFGSELFERLYNGDNDVKWIVSLDDYEEYFRRKQSGESISHPDNYKTENAIWYSLMETLSGAGSWRHMLQNSVGSQWSAGNLSVKLLNEISNIIEEKIESGSFDVKMLTQAASELQQMRDDYKEAMQNGDIKTAQNIRQKAKQLAQDMQDALEKAQQDMSPQVAAKTSEVLQEHMDEEQALDNLYGNGSCEPKMLGDIESKRKLAEKLRANPKLVELAKRLGSLKKMWVERKRVKVSQSKFDCVNGVEFDSDIPRALPTELAMAATEEGRALFALKYTQRTLLCRDYTSKTKNLGKGNVIMYLDISGSMDGDREQWMKAISIVVTEQALKENRKVHIHLFDNRIVSSKELLPDSDNKQAIDFITSIYTGGGTSFNAVIEHMLEQKYDPKSDVLIITDGHAGLRDNTARALNVYKNTTGTEVSALCIDQVVPEPLERISDRAYTVDITDDKASIDCIQQSIR